MSFGCTKSSTFKTNKYNCVCIIRKECIFWPRGSGHSSLSVSRRHGRWLEGSFWKTFWLWYRGTISVCHLGDMSQDLAAPGRQAHSERLGPETVGVGTGLRPQQRPPEGLQKRLQKSCGQPGRNASRRPKREGSGWWGHEGLDFGWLSPCLRDEGNKGTSLGGKMRTARLGLLCVCDSHVVPSPASSHLYFFSVPCLFDFLSNLLTRI